MPKKERVKRARAKPKNVIQKVVVNVGGRGGGGRKSTAPAGPPRPTPLQQATQFVQSSLARDASLVQSFQPRQGESMVQSAQMLQRLIDPINARLDAFVRQQVPGPVNNITMPPINITNPPINIQQPDIFMAPPNVSINQRFPNINIQAPNFPNMEPHRYHDRQHVADLPDDPLVRPNAPLVLAGPMRMDDPHEDVPLDEVDPALVGKQEAKRKPIIGDESSEEEAEAEAEAQAGPAQAGVRSIMDNIPIRRDILDKMPLKRKVNTSSNTIVLTELASYLGLALPRNILAGGKNAVVDYILQNRQR
jgi:hypothetical protein